MLEDLDKIHSMLDHHFRNAQKIHQFSHFEYVVDQPYGSQSVILMTLPDQITWMVIMSLYIESELIYLVFF